MAGTGKIDYSQADESEEFEWGRADLATRCLLALKKGRPVRFQGKVYSGLEQAGELEDAISESGRLVTVGKDDATGVLITAGGYEQ